MRLIPISLLSLFFTGNLTAQRIHQYRTEIGGYTSSEKDLPFWMRSNTQGLVRTEENANAIIHLSSDFATDNPRRLDFSYGTTLLGLTSSDRSKVEINELYAALQYRNIRLTGGSKQVDVGYAGLSSTNGNLTFSGNARPLAGISLETSQFIPLLFKGKLSFSAEFGNYYLNDDRFVDDAQLHHKNFYFKIQTSKKSNLIVGIEDYAIWAGTSPTLGKLPSDLSDFLRVTGGLGGDEAAPEAEATNGLGDHLGIYRIAFRQKTEKFDWEFYLNHPFEDKSGGRILDNFEDGLFGVFINFRNPESLLSHWLFEFTYTKNQSGPKQVDGFDNYFNNNIYRSGYTFFGRTIGSPFFTPADKDENGITNGVINNSFIAFHTGFRGKLTNHLYYKTMLSYSINEGLKGNKFDENKKQFSGLVDFNYITPKLPFSISLGVGIDSGDLFEDSFGVYIKLLKMGVF